MKTWKKYLITLLIGFVTVGLMVWSRGITAQTSTKMVYHILVDMFFVVGFVMTAAGLLVFSSNQGTFDMLIYGTRSFLDLFRKVKKQKYETFYDYREARAEKKLPFGFIVVCGLFFLTISMIMYYFYRKYS